jgi:hypothetical protein
MSQDVLVALARRVAADVSEQPRIEALEDGELAELGLDPDEIQSIRTGFFDRVLWLGISAAEDSPGCCMP